MAKNYRAETDKGLRSSTPPEQYEIVHQWVLSTTLELQALCWELREAVRMKGQTARPDLAEVPERMALVASELATNGTEYGRTPTIVTLENDGSRYLLDVADHDPHTVPVLDGRRASGAGGFGLQIARRVGQELGWYTAGTTEHVWVTCSPYD